VTGDEDRRGAISIQRSKLLRHSLDDLEFPTQLVVLLIRALLNQNCLNQVRRVDNDDLCAQRHYGDTDDEQRNPYTTRHDFLLVSEPM
jgi:hypothetical protein